MLDSTFSRGNQPNSPQPARSDSEENWTDRIIEILGFATTAIFLTATAVFSAFIIWNGEVNLWYHGAAQLAPMVPFALARKFLIGSVMVIQPLMYFTLFVIVGRTIFPAVRRPKEPTTLRESLGL